MNYSSSGYSRVSCASRAATRFRLQLLIGRMYVNKIDVKVREIWPRRRREARRHLVRRRAPRRSDDKVLRPGRHAHDQGVPQVALRQRSQHRKEVTTQPGDLDPMITKARTFKLRPSNGRLILCYMSKEGVSASAYLTKPQGHSATHENAAGYCA